MHAPSNQPELIEFSGFVVRDAERKTSAKGHDYFVITVGSKRPDGETKWVKTRVFDPSAVPDDFTKGCEVIVRGKVSRDEWIGKDGEKRSGWSCMTRDVRITKGGRADVQTSTT
jgi:single-stranded DNA-binding protein